MSISELYEIFLKSGSVCTDSRNIVKGSIFFALKGENFNANSFAAEALSKGCYRAVIDDARYQSEKTILVDDSLAALQELAALHRTKFKIPLLAITGSNAKTTTRELISSVLRKKYKVVSTSGNLNNHIGLPLSILKLNKDTDIAVIEMGASHCGEIARLCEIAQPAYGIITNIAFAHIEGFGSEAGVIKAKSELYEWLGSTDGTIFRNSDDSMLESISPPGTKIIPYSLNNTGQGSLSLLEADPYLKLMFRYEGEETEIATKLFGEYNLINIAAATAVGIHFNLPLKDIFSALSGYSPGNKRSQVYETGNNRLILDSYNANPSSMEVAVNSFSKLSAKKKLIILGDMSELGPDSHNKHCQLIKRLEELEDIEVILVGKHFYKAARGSSFRLFAGKNECMDYFSENKLKGYSILLKGSRKMSLESLIPVF